MTEINSTSADAFLAQLNARVDVRVPILELSTFFVDTWIDER